MPAPVALEAKKAAQARIEAERARLARMHERSVNKRKAAVRRPTEPVQMSELWRACCNREMHKRHAGWYDVLRNIINEGRKRDPHHWRDVRVHDGACGTGELMEGLHSLEGRHRLGIIFSGSDMSGDMLTKQLFTHARKAATESPWRRPQVHQLAWHELPGHFRDVHRGGPNSKPHILIIPGASIPYAGAWDRNPETASPQKREMGIRVAANAFYESLQPGGKLAITTTPQRSFDNITRKGGESESFLSTIRGRPVRISEQITHNPKERMRIWNTRIEFLDTREVQEKTRKAFMLPPSELAQILKDAGFIKVRRVDIPGEPYEGLIAERPAQK